MIPFVDGRKLLTPEAFEFLQDIVNALNGSTAANGFVEIELGGVAITIGSGSPNGVVVGSPPDLFLNLSGGASTTLYVKESGAETNTGWVGK
jgi:hypothetical protein